MAETFATRLPNLRVVRQAKNGGVSRARNLAASQGSLLAFLDADDLRHPLYLAKMAGALRARPDAAFAYIYLRRVYLDGRVSGVPLRPSISGWAFYQMLDEAFVGSGSNALFRAKSRANSVGTTTRFPGERTPTCSSSPPEGARRARSRIPCRLSHCAGVRSQSSAQVLRTGFRCWISFSWRFPGSNVVRCGGQGPTGTSAWQGRSASPVRARLSRSCSMARPPSPSTGKVSPGCCGCPRPVMATGRRRRSTGQGSESGDPKII